MSPPAIGEFAIWYVVFLFSLTVHEAGHALFAWLGGDDTAYRGGQVSLNPLPHMRREPFGTILVPALSFFTAGWMMGWASTPFDPRWGRRHPGRQAAMSAAGPAGNFLIALMAMIVLKILLAGGILDPPTAAGFGRLAVPPPEAGPGSLLLPLALTLSVAINLNVLLGLFNLLPLPPLDGAGVLEGLFPGSFGRLMASLRTQPALGLLGLLAAWKLFGLMAGPTFGIILRLVHPGLSYS